MAKRFEITTDEYGIVDESRPTYDDIVETFGTIHAEASDDNYSGDSLYLIEGVVDGWTRFGILTFGWGSCSGCDALQDVRSQEEMDKLQDDLERGIKWFDFLDDAKTYLRDGGLKDTYLDADLVLRFGGKVAEVAA